MITPGTTVNEKQTGNAEEQHWDNPRNPEQASDTRDNEQMERQKREAELRKANLTDDSENTEDNQSSNK